MKWKPWVLEISPDVAIHTSTSEQSPFPAEGEEAHVLRLKSRRNTPVLHYFNYALVFNPPLVLSVV